MRSVFRSKIEVHFGVILGHPIYEKWCPPPPPFCETAAFTSFNCTCGLDQPGRVPRGGPVTLIIRVLLDPFGGGVYPTLPFTCANGVPVPLSSILTIS